MQRRFCIGLLAAVPMLLGSHIDPWQPLRYPLPGTAILYRHALAPGTGDPLGFRLEDCTTQRNLSTAGREQAKRMGSALTQRGIPVSRVLSSQWCRCLETATLMAVGSVEPFSPLNSFFSDRRTEASQTQQVLAWLRDQTAQGETKPGIIVMVTHQVNITALTGIVPASGEGISVRFEEGQLRVLGRIPPS